MKSTEEPAPDLILWGRRVRDGAAMLALKTPIPASCCDGRMVFFVVNREGQTRCMMCDDKERP